MPPLLSSFRRQQLLLEYASVKIKCPDGIYLAPEATNSAIWSGVFFVRQGPYSSAVLRFELAFPAAYPDVGPLLNFSTEIFHPLLVPLTTYTFTAGAIDPNTSISSRETERLTPGSLNLRHEFATWYLDQDEIVKNERISLSAEDKQRHSIHNVLSYMEKAFESAEFLDDLPFRAAVNVNAWHAWRAYRGLPKLESRSVSPASMESSRTPLSPGRNPKDWNWDGVWESRVKNGTEESTSDALLYGSKTRGANMHAGSIRFVKHDDDQIQDIQASMLRAFGINQT